MASPLLPPRKKARVQQHDEDGQLPAAPRFAKLFAWAKSSGVTGIDSLTVSADGCAFGVGLVTAKELGAGATVISLPQAAILTLGHAVSSAMGRLARASATEWGAAAADVCTDARVLRCRDYWMDR